MRTLAIKEITQMGIEVKSKEEQEKEGKSPFYTEDGYHRFFALTVEYSDDIVKEVHFGYLNCYTKNHRPILFAKSIHDFREKLEEKIYTFCQMYKDKIFDGKDILTIVQEDKENILNYTLEIDKKRKEQEPAKQFRKIKTNHSQKR